MNKKIHSLAWNNSPRQIVAASGLETGKTVDDAEAARTKLEMLLEVLGLLLDFAGEHAMPILGFPDGEVKVGTASALHGVDWVSSLIPPLERGARRQGDCTGAGRLFVHPQPAHSRPDVDLRRAHTLSTWPADRSLECCCFGIGSMAVGPALTHSHYELKAPVDEFLP